MTCCDQPGLMLLEQATDRLLELISPCSDVETVALDQALDRVLAEDMVARYPVPGFDNSAMDGYAICLQGFSTDSPQHIQGRSMAGAPYQGALKLGNCVRIMTGAPVPEGTEAVVMQEEVSADGREALVKRLPKKGENIRRKGEDLAEGAVALSAGLRLGPADLALLSAIGAQAVPVYRKARVALFSTGDELREPGEPLGHGDIYDANRPAIRALLEQLNVDILDLGILPDNLEAVRDAILKADAQCDFIVTSGGVSVGDADYVRDVLDQEGRVEFWKLAIKPGKPFAFGKLRNSWFIGLPGNPVSAIVTFQLLGVPAIRQFQGSGYQPMQQLRARLHTSVCKKPGRKEFLRGRYRAEGDTLSVELTRPHQGSHVLTSVSNSNCYLVLDEATTTVEEGEMVTIWLPESS